MISGHRLDHREAIGSKILHAVLQIRGAHPCRRETASAKRGSRSDDGLLDWVPMSRHEQIETRLKETFAPTHLVIENESHMHSVKPGSETHFKVVVVSPTFEGLSLVARQRRVNASLSELFAAGLHALTMKVATPAEWASSPEVLASPDCLGGSKAARTARKATDEPD